MYYLHAWAPRESHSTSLVPVATVGGRRLRTVVRENESRPVLWPACRLHVLSPVNGDTDESKESGEQPIPFRPR